MKKSLEVVGYVAIEVSLALLSAVLLVSGTNALFNIQIPEDMISTLQAVLSGAFVYFGKQFVKKIKE